MKYFMVIGTLLLFSVQGWSWGSLGHKASAKVAWQFLDQNTRNQVTELLGETSFADASVWADAARGNNEWKFTIWYHFEKAPDNMTYLDNLRRLDEPARQTGGLIEALYVADETMRDPRASRLDRENALKFAIHFVGDIHQPLHTGRPEDNGGNKIRVSWLGRDVSLHSIWDSQIIYLAHRDLLAQATDVSGDRDQAQLYADYLMTKFKNFRPTPNLFVRYDDWMHESMDPRAQAYEHRDESEESYTRRFADTVDERIYLAGLRIAYMTKRMLKRERPTQPLQQLRSAIVSIVGNFTEFVSLKPRFEDQSASKIRAFTPSFN